MTKAKESVNEMTEAPVSANVKLVGANGADIMLTVRAGATVEQVTGVLDVMVKAINIGKEKYNLSPAKAHGFSGNANGASANGNAPAANGSGISPVCPTHATPMKQSQHGAGWYCPKRVAEMGGGADGSKPIYCKAKA